MNELIEKVRYQVCGNSKIIKLNKTYLFIFKNIQLFQQQF